MSHFYGCISRYMRSMIGADLAKRIRSEERQLFHGWKSSDWELGFQVCAEPFGEKGCEI